MQQYFLYNPIEYDRVIHEDFVSTEFGDRRQEIVFIGIQLHSDNISSALNACLLNDNEMEQYRQKLQNYMDTKNTNPKEKSRGLFDVDTINHSGY